jgi:Flp pilus assembly protein TadG
MTCEFQRRGAKHRKQARVALECSERGSSLLEQSFILVFLLTMMFGIIDCGRALYTYHFVSNVAREASRWASVRSQSCDGSALSGCPADLSGNNVRTTFKANLSSMGLDPTKVTFTTSWVVPPGVGATSCPTPNSNHVGCMVHVDVTYAYTFFFAPFIAAPAINMSSSSEMLITN